MTTNPIWILVPWAVFAVALAFGALQFCWIGSVFWKWTLARPLSEGEFRKAKQRFRKKRSQTDHSPTVPNSTFYDEVFYGALQGGSTFLLREVSPKGL